jgi:hypothetical protein
MPGLGGIDGSVRINPQVAAQLGLGTSNNVRPLNENRGTTTTSTESHSTTTESHGSTRSVTESGGPGPGGVTGVVGFNSRGGDLGGGLGTGLGGGGGGSSLTSSQGARNDVQSSTLGQNTFNVSLSARGDEGVITRLSRYAALGQEDSRIENHSDIADKTHAGIGIGNTISSGLNSGVNGVVAAGKLAGDLGILHAAKDIASVTGPLAIGFAAVDTVLAGIDLGNSVARKGRAVDFRESNGNSTINDLREQSVQLRRDINSETDPTKKQGLINQVNNVDRQIERLTDRQSSVGELKGRKNDLALAQGVLNNLTAGGTVDAFDSATLRRAGINIAAGSTVSADQLQGLKDRVGSRLESLGKTIESKEKVEGLETRRAGLQDRLDNIGFFSGRFTSAGRAERADINRQINEINRDIKAENRSNVEGGNAATVAQNVEENANTGRKAFSFLKAAATLALAIAAVAVAATGVGAIVIAAVGIGVAAVGIGLAVYKAKEERDRRSEVSGLENKFEDTSNKLNNLRSGGALPEGVTDRGAEIQRLEREQRQTLDRLIEKSPVYAKKAIINDLQSSDVAVRTAAITVARDVLNLSSDDIDKITKSKKADGSGGQGPNAISHQEALQLLHRNIQ